MFGASIAVAICAPILAAVLLFCLDKFTPFGKLKPIIKQIVFGVVLGGVAIAVSEFAVPYNGVFISTRNAVIVLSGLIFGWPAGLITGGMVALERGISYIWAPDQIAVIATAVGAALTGAYIFLLRKFLFKDKRPSFLFTLATTIVAEALSLLLVLLFNLNQSGTALTYIGNVTIPAVIGTLCVGLAAPLGVELCDLKNFKASFKEKKEIAFKIQNLMLGVVSVLFIASVGAIYAIEDNKCKVETKETLRNGIDTPLLDIDVRMDVDINNELIQFEFMGNNLHYYEDNEFHKRLMNIINNYPFVPVTFAQLIDSTGTVRATAHYNDDPDGDCGLVVPVGFNYFTHTEDYDLCKIMTDYYNSSVIDEETRFCTKTLKTTKDFIYSPFQFDSAYVDTLYCKYSATAFDYNHYLGGDVDKWLCIIGFDNNDYDNMYRNHSSDITKNSKVGKSGVSLIYEAYQTMSGDINLYSISAPTGYDGDSYNLEESGVYFKEIYNNLNLFIGQNDYSQFNYPLRNEPGYAMVYSEYDTLYTTYTIYASIASQREMTESRDNAIMISALLQVLIFAVLFAFIYILVNKSVVKPLDKVTGSLNKISGGDLDETVAVTNSTEFVQLSSDINKTVDTLKDFIEKEKNRLAKDLALAKSIQKNALPSVYPNDPRITLAASMDTAKEVGGDFYDFYIPKEDQVNVLIADVSGKGVPAAMFMMRAKTQLKSLSEIGTPIDETFTQANEELCNGNEAGMFVTTWQANIDMKTGLMTYVNAGHNPPVIKKKNGKFEFLKSKVGFVLAGFEGFKYKPQEYQLEKGDIVFLYTDGITEATSAQTELYGDDRLLNILNSLKGDQLKPENILKLVLEDVNKFVGDAPQFDDETMVCFVYNGKK